MPESGTVLVVEDERIAMRNLEHVLRKQGYEVLSAASGAKALSLLDAHEVDVVLTDVRLPGSDGMRILARCREAHPDVEVILVTGYGTLEGAVEAMRQGAFYYVAKPFRLDEVRAVVREAMAKVRLKRENRALKGQLQALRGGVEIITGNPRMQRLLQTAEQVAPTGCNVLISGASGTGKELLARYVHTQRGRRDGPFLGVNCGAFSEELLATELFGHERGAFTGAVGKKAGLVEAASGGTLFLDEVTEMPASMQVKLLRVIQEREVLRVGATRPVEVDVRFIAATNRDVQQAMRSGHLRQDLYFRLNVVELQVPPLHQRRDDVPLLAHYFLERHAARMGKAVREIAPEVLTALSAYSFPGNVRELENLMARGVALARGATVELRHLPEELRDPVPVAAPRGRWPSLAEHEAAYLQQVLAEANGNKTAAARILGIDRVSLWRKLKRFGLDGQAETPGGP